MYMIKYEEFKAALTAINLQNACMAKLFGGKV